jgi:phage terminase large subunit
MDLIDNPDFNFFEVNLADGFNVVRQQISSVLVGSDDGDIDFAQYQDDPVRFGEEVFGETYTDDVKELMISVRDNRDTLAKSANATGKSHAAARIALWFFLCFPDSQVFTAAAPPEDNLRKILWAEIGLIVERHPHVFKGIKVNDLHISRHPKSFLTGVTIPTQGTEAQREGRFSGKHAPFIMFIFDEADAIPNECYRGAESCMSGGHARLLAMFNPRHESGILYQKEKKRVIHVVQLNAFRHPNVHSGEDVYPGAVTRAKTIQRINDWTIQVQPNELGQDGEPTPNIRAECFLVPEFLVGETTLNPAGKMYPPIPAGWRHIIEPSFSYMVLGEYPAVADGQLISRAWINNARSRWDSYVAQYGRKPPEGIRPIVGLDVAEMGVDSNVAALRYGGWVPPLEAWSEIDTNRTAELAADLAINLRAEFVAVDGTGVGAGVAPKIEGDYSVEAYSVKMNSKPSYEVEEGEFTHMRDQLWWMTREWLRHDKDAMLPPDERLIDELTTPTYSISSGKIKIMKKDDMKALLGRSPDRAEALILTFYNEFVESQSADSLAARVFGIEEE